jgi:preprotein translocase subunit YajC
VRFQYPHEVTIATMSKEQTCVLFQGDRVWMTGGLITVVITLVHDRDLRIEFISGDDVPDTVPTEWAAA